MSQESKRLFWYRLKLLMLIAVFLAPFIGGWFALYVFEVRPPSGNYGELVEPVRKLNWPPMETADGKRLDSGFGRKWTFLLFSGGTCETQCRANLFYMRQIRILLGRDTPRLQNVLIVAQPLSVDLTEFLSEYPDLIVIDNNRDENLYRQFRLQGFDAVSESAKMYMVDPDQNLMMHYPADNDQNRILEDIRKLMKLSQIG